MKKRLWQDWANLVLGLWLFLSPWFALGSAESAAWNSWLMGLAIVFFAILALSAPQKWEEWTNLVIGIWLILAPFLLGFTAEAGAMWNHIIVGFLVGGDALLALQAPVHRTATQT